MFNMKQFLRDFAGIPVLAGAAFLSLGLAAQAAAPAATPAGAAPAAVAASSDQVPRGTVMSDLALGSDKAPVTVIEYASFTCPHCAEFYDHTFPEVKQKLIDTGKIRYIYRDFPLDRLALKASVLARCSGAQNYYGYVDVLFKQQLSWATEKNPMEGLRELARLGGMSDARFDACMASKPIEQAVLESRLEAQKKYGVDATPSFIINGVKYAGAMSYDQFDKLIEPLLLKTSGEAAPAAGPKVAAAAPATSAPAASSAVTPASQPAASKKADPPPAESGRWLLKGAGIAVIVVVLAGLGFLFLRGKGRA